MTSSRRKSLFVCALSACVVLVPLTSVAGASARAAARRGKQPTILANPTSLMVNQSTALKGSGFPKNASVTLRECASSSWIAPQQPCLEGHSVTVETGRSGHFSTSFKVGVCEGEFSGADAEDLLHRRARAQRHRHDRTPRCGDDPGQLPLTWQARDRASSPARRLKPLGRRWLPIPHRQGTIISAPPSACGPERRLSAGRAGPREVLGMIQRLAATVALIVIASAGASVRPLPTLADVGVGSWSVTGSLLGGHADETAVTLANGRVLVLHADDEEVTPDHPSFSERLATELYEPDSGTWISGPAPPAPNASTLVRLADGGALLLGNPRVVGWLSGACRPARHTV